MTASVDGQQSSQASTIPPEVQLAEMLSGLWLWWMLYIVAERAVADLLARAAGERRAGTGHGVARTRRSNDCCGRLRASGCLPRSRRGASR